MKANARLIAAAPELFMELRAIEQLFAAWKADDSIPSASLCSAIENEMPAIRAAIDKATKGTNL